MPGTKITKNGDYIHISASDWKKDDEDGKIRTITLSKKDNIKALFNVDKRKLFVYLFGKDKWNKESAEKWMNKVSENFELDKESLEQTALDAIQESFNLIQESDSLESELKQMGKASDFVAIQNALTQVLLKSHYFINSELKRLKKERPKDQRLNSFSKAVEKMTDKLDNDYTKYIRSM